MLGMEEISCSLSMLSVHCPKHVISYVHVDHDKMKTPKTLGTCENEWPKRTSLNKSAYVEVMT